MFWFWFIAGWIVLNALTKDSYNEGRADEKEENETY